MPHLFSFTEFVSRGGFMFEGPKRYLIAGPQGSGKSTFGKMLAEALRTTSHDTSEWLIKCETLRQKALWNRYQILPVMQQHGAEIAMPPEYEGKIKGHYIVNVKGWNEERDRPSRELLVALGDAVNELDRTFLVNWCFSQGRVCVGVRRKPELQAIRAAYPPLNLVTIILSGRQGPEVETDNFELANEEFDWKVVNDGSLEDLREQAQNTAAIFEGLR